MKPNTLLVKPGIAILSLALSLPVLKASQEPEAASAAGTVVVIGETASAAPVVSNPRLAKLLKEASYSAGVNEVAELAEQGTDHSVLSAYVLNSDASHRLRAEDITHLRDHGVPDDVISLMIEQRSENRAQQRKEASSLPEAQSVQPPVPVPTVTFVPAPTRLVPPASTLTIIGRSDLDRGLSYRRHYYSARNYYAPRRYSSVYSSHASRSYYGRQRGAYRPYGDGYAGYRRSRGSHAYVCR